MTDLHTKLLAAFRMESAEHLERIRAALPGLAGNRAGMDLDDIYRRAHSLKGAARAVGLLPVETLAHRLETLFSRLREGALEAAPAVLELAGSVLDAIEDHAAALGGGREGPDSGAVLREIEALLGGAAAGGSTPPPRPAAAPAPPAEPVAPVETVRIRTSHLDSLLSSTGELLTESLRQEGLAGALDRHRHDLLALQKEWDRVRSGPDMPVRRLRGTPEFAPVWRFLELFEQRLRDLARQAGALHSAQRRGAAGLRRLTDRIQDDVREARLVAAQSLFDGFRKMVRDLARDQGKQVEFQVSGLDVVADRRVLQTLKDPVMHLLRNAVGHGLEAPAQRRALGKPETGLVSLSLAARGRRLRLEVADDGRGLDPAAIAAVARQGGLLDGAGPAVSREALGRLIFRSGFSTAPAVTEVSGRGMGLSVVEEAVRALQGEIELPPRPGPGFAVVLDVPLMVSLQRLLLVDSADQTFAVPTHAIDRLLRVPAAAVASIEGRAVLAHCDEHLPFAPLAGLLGAADGGVRTEGDRLPVILLRAAGRRLAVAVDRFLAETDSLIRDLGCTGGSLDRWYAGGIVLPDGAVCPVLNPAGLLDSYDRGQGAAPLHWRRQAATPPRPPSILVVDDSFTTRTLEKGLLEAHGYRVQVAVDGLDALDKLRREPADLVITDLQMPRLDGFGFLEAVKQDPAFKDIPVIIVSSMESQAEQARGLALGADAYVVKRKFEQRELLETIGQML